MSAERIADLRSDRPQTLDAAHALFCMIAQLTLTLAAQDATFEKRIAKLKADHNAATSDDRAILLAGGDLLAKFIEQHKDLFADPRKVQTSLGSFGLQAVSELIISDPERLEQAVLEAGYDDCFKSIISLIKPAIKKRIKDGGKLPGARINYGDTAVYNVDKTLVDQAKDSAS